MASQLLQDFLVAFKKKSPPRSRYLQTNFADVRRRGLEASLMLSEPITFNCLHYRKCKGISAVEALGGRYKRERRFGG